jgi:hypothetical protein
MLPSFFSETELVAWRIPKSATYRLIRLEERNLCVEQKHPKPFAPGIVWMIPFDARLSKGCAIRKTQTMLAFFWIGLRVSATPKPPDEISRSCQKKFGAVELRVVS